MRKNRDLKCLNHFKSEVIGLNEESIFMNSNQIHKKIQIFLRDFKLSIVDSSGFFYANPLDYCYFSKDKNKLSKLRMHFIKNI